ncbi:splicing factor 1-like [Chironomus tepperi]|uniref:splicing factor 1-like n=1 Tax=Chironomus tepperi TaxID=113505 RepID=UPI00391F0EA9
MSKHKDKDKDRSRDDLRSRERDRDHRKRSRERSKDRSHHKKSKDRSKRSRSRKSSRRDRSRDRSRERTSRKERSRSRDSRRSRSYERSHRRVNSPPTSSVMNTMSAASRNLEITPSQQAQITQFLSASLSNLTPQQSTAHSLAQFTTIQPDTTLRTDFSNLFQSTSTNMQVASVPNSAALKIASEKAKSLLKAKNLTDTLKTASNGNSIASNGNDSSRDGEEFRSGSYENSIGGICGEASNSGGDKKRKKKSRWATSTDGAEGKTFIPGMPTVLPSNLNPDQQEAYLVQLQIEEISRKLRTGDLGIPLNPEERSPSPEPIYSTDGKRLNTREFRTRKKLEEQRHLLITRMQCMNPEFKPPADYKPPITRVSDKVLIPQEEYPDINFVGLLIGPRGNTLKAMEKETGAKIIIRGKGSVKEGKVGRKDGQPLPGEDEPLHAFITANNLESVKKAVDKIKEVIKQGIEVPEGSNDLRRMQLRELAQLNGTLRETDGPRCTNCGSTEHKSFLCPDKPNVTNNIVCSACGSAGHISKDCKSKRPGLGGIEGSNNQAKIDEEYMSLMAELGEAPQETITQREAPIPPLPPQKPSFNIFDNQRHQQPRPLSNLNNNINNNGNMPTPGPPTSVAPPPPWHQHPPPPVQPHPHPMGQYPPLPGHHPWMTSLPPLPGEYTGHQKMSIPPPHIMPPPQSQPLMIPPPPGTDVLPPGTHPISFNSFDDDRFGKKSQPPLPSFLPPPPPPE